MRYVCPECGGTVRKVYIVPGRHYRWTCSKCNADYCYDTPEPCGAIKEARS